MTMKYNPDLKVLVNAGHFDLEHTRCIVNLTRGICRASIVA